MHVSSFSGDGLAGGVVNFLVDSVDALHTEFVKKGVPVAVEPVNQTWGTREMYVQDADGNHPVQSGMSPIHWGLSQKNKLLEIFRARASTLALGAEAICAWRGTRRSAD